MKILIGIGMIVGVVLVGYVFVNQVIRKHTMELNSPAFAANQIIPPQYTCAGSNVNPPLQFISVPSGAKSLVLIVDDPDAPGGTWVHWVVFNMPVSTGGLAENTKPPGLEGVTSFGKNEYGGPCPPSGTHRYFFRLYALDTELSLQENADAALVNSMIQGHIIDKAELMGTVSKDH